MTAEYALRAMACLAQSGGLVATPVLAERTRVPPNYLAKVLQLLAGAELIAGRRGIGGGYHLSRPAEKITLLEVVRAVNPNVSRIEACPLGIPGHGPRLCPLHRRLDKAAEAVIGIFQGATLRDLLDEPGAPPPLCESAPRALVAVTVPDRKERARR